MSAILHTSFWSPDFRHLNSPVADLELHLSILQLLQQMIERDERSLVQQLSLPHSVFTMHWSASHLPSFTSLNSVQQVHLIMQPLPGVLGLSLEDAERVQVLQVQVNGDTKSYSAHRELHFSQIFMVLSLVDVASLAAVAHPAVACGSSFQ
jgi:hypothetical protein